MNLISRIAGRLAEEYRRAADNIAVCRIRLRRQSWPCPKKQFLLVGCESSGTTIMARLLFRGGSLRFFREGKDGNEWCWQAYQEIYQGHKSIRDYPRLQLYDAVKVPGFAAILSHYVREFPNVSILCTVRDPRDVVASACKTWGVTPDNGLQSIKWVTESWLDVPEKDPIARLAWRWRIYLERSRLVPGVTYVRYEDFCADKVHCIMRLAGKLDIEVDEARIKELCDQQASLPVTRGYRPKGPGSWREGLLTDRDIRVIEEICGDLMEFWNYPKRAANRQCSSSGGTDK